MRTIIATFALSALLCAPAAAMVAWEEGTPEPQIEKKNNAKTEKRADGGTEIKTKDGSITIRMGREAKPGEGAAPGKKPAQ